jgi:Domain of unknown function (DUF4234)
MTDAMPPTPPAEPPTPPPPPMPPAYPVAPQGWGPAGQARNPWAVFGLSLITCGIYFLYWTYVTFQEMKDHSHEGLGGPLGLVIGIFVGFVNVFLIPYEVGNMYAKSGEAKPVTGLTGFWTLIPLVGLIIWLIKVQGALNVRWELVAAQRMA